MDLLHYGEAVDDRQFREQVAQRTSSLVLGHPSHSFLGAQPVSFTRQHITQLLIAEDYYVCEKSDGVRFLLYFCAPWGEPLALLIDRNMAMRALPGYAVPTRAGGAHEETLLDGELVDEGGRVVFLIFDALMVSGRSLVDLDLNGRLKAVQNEVVGPAAAVQHMAPELRLKKMWKPYAIAEVLEREIPAQQHGNDGLIFTPVADVYRPGTCARLLKWKPPEQNTVDFLVRLNPSAVVDDERIELHVACDGNRHCFFAHHPWDESVAALDGAIVECRYIQQSNEWRFNKTRPDKRSANYERIARAIIDSISDNVTSAELIAAIPSIRRSWKTRESQQTHH